MGCEKVPKVRKDICFYSFFSLILSLSLTGGIILSGQAHLNLNEFPYSGTVLNTECSTGWTWDKGYYNRDIGFIISYTVSGNKYIEVYETNFFQECATASSWDTKMNTCCEHLIGDTVYLNLSPRNITVINEISTISGSSATGQIFFAIIFFLFSFITLVILVKTGIDHYRNGYLKFPFSKNIPLIRDDFDDNQL